MPDTDSRRDMDHKRDQDDVSPVISFDSYYCMNDWSVWYSTEDLQYDVHISLARRHGRRLDPDPLARHFVEIRVSFFRFATRGPRL